jgi:hypothetical protein
MSLLSAMSLESATSFESAASLRSVEVLEKFRLEAIKFLWSGPEAETSAMVKELSEREAGIHRNIT